jgi:hypothetical protein
VAAKSGSSSSSAAAAAAAAAAWKKPLGGAAAAAIAATISGAEYLAAVSRLGDELNGNSCGGRAYVRPPGHPVGMLMKCAA